MASMNVKLVTARHVIGDSFTLENPFETKSALQAAVPEQLGPVSDDADEEAPGQGGSGENGERDHGETEAGAVADLHMLRDEGYEVLCPEEFYISELRMTKERAARAELKIADAKAEIEKLKEQVRQLEQTARCSP